MARRRDEPEFNFDQEIVDIIPERFDHDPDSREARAGHRRNWVMTLGLTTAVLVCLGAVGLYFFSGRSGSTGQGGVPVIKADQGPLKSRPDDRGGMEVPNQDKLVYERMGSAASDPKVERLLPPPEAPQAPPAAGQAPAARPAPPATPPAAAPPPAARPAAPVAPPAAPPPAASAPRNEPPAPAAVPQGQVAASPVGPAATPPKPAPAPSQPAAAAAAPKPVSPPPAAAAPPPGDFVVQLAALKSQADAEKTWAQVSKQNADLLGSLKSSIVQVDLGQKGIFFRLRAGPMDEASAKKLCGQLAERKVGCIVSRK